MNLLDKVLGVATGGLAETALEVAKTWFPPDMSEADKKAAQVAFNRLELKRQQQTDSALQEATKGLTQRITELEGTASDLKALPIVGRIVLFARGAQRPTWGFATLWMDYKWFSGGWGALSEQQEMALIVINVLVLGFLFGERAVKNLMPLIMRLLAKGTG